MIFTGLFRKRRVEKHLKELIGRYIICGSDLGISCNYGYIDPNRNSAGKLKYSLIFQYSTNIKIFEQF